MRDDEAEGHVTALDHETVRDIALQVAEGVAVLHENGIVHRDIKPQNILKCDDQWKLADFGISKRIDKPVTGYTFQGAHSPPWAPPEQIAGVPANTSADVYAVARVILFLLTGSDDFDLAEASEEWRQVLAPCLEITPEKRPDIHALKAAIEGL